MSDPAPWVTAAFAAVLAASLCAVLTPLAMRLARRTDMLDRPSGHKAHARPTPLLGGASVTLSFVVTVAILAPANWLLPSLLLAALLLLGTLDDRVGLGPAVRIAIVAAAACSLSFASLGWSVFDQGALDLLLTVAFVLAVVNAVNLMDNMDGAAVTVSGATGLILGGFALAEGAEGVAVLGLAIAGTCGCFAFFNLRRPSRIFLGDGGSMPLGLAVALLIMSLPGAMSEPGGGQLGLGLILVSVLIVGLPAFDTALVIRSRTRRSVSILTGGQDHLTHRLLLICGSPQRVAVVLFLAQASILVAATVIYAQNETIAVVSSVVIMALAAAMVERLDGRPSPGRRLQERDSAA